MRRAAVRHHRHPHPHRPQSLSGVLPYIFNVPVTAAQQQAIDSYTSTLTNRLEQLRARRSPIAGRRVLSWSQGRAGFAANRRVLKDGKWTGFGVTPDGAVDHDVPVLAVHGPDGALRAVLVNYACHATTLEGRDNFVHGDWPGAAKRADSASGIRARSPWWPSGPVPTPTRTLAVAGSPTSSETPRRLPTKSTACSAAPTAADSTSLPRGTSRDDRSAARTRAVTAGMGGTGEARRPRRVPGAGDPRAASIVANVCRHGALSDPDLVRSATDLAMVFLGGEVVADYGLRLKRELDGVAALGQRLLQRRRVLRGVEAADSRGRLRGRSIDGVLRSARAARRQYGGPHRLDGSSAPAGEPSPRAADSTLADSPRTDSVQLREVS